MSAPEQKKDLTIPGAILAGSAIIGAGLFFGLRSRGSEASVALPSPIGAAGSTQASPSPQLAPGAPGAPGAAAPGQAVAPGEAAAPAAPAGPTDELKQKVIKQVTEALEGQRKDLVKECWAPAAKANPEPALARYSFNVTFNAEGTEIARGISDVRGFERPDVGQCLRQRSLGLRIPPPGVNVMVDVPFTLP